MPIYNRHNSRLSKSKKKSRRSSRRNTRRLNRNQKSLKSDSANIYTPEDIERIESDVIKKYKVNPTLRKKIEADLLRDYGIAIQGNNINVTLTRAENTKPVEKKRKGLNKN